MEGGLTRDGVLGGETLLLFTGANDLTGLATLIDSDDLNHLAACGLLQVDEHLLEDGELIERQLPAEDGLWLLAALDKTSLQGLDERHSLLHLTHLAHLGVQLLVVDGEVETIEGLADQIDVLLLPRGVLLGSVDCELLGLTGVVASALALGSLLGELSLSRGDARGSGPDIGADGCQLR